ncbi:MAG: beta-ketoacyl synthase chain length factor [Ferruginibacter sp.]|nr:beta-ketoacyl synthase chain length factor [Ferruginibacter sp.]
MPMFYIHQTSCISPQQTFDSVDISVLHQPVEHKLKVIEPVATGIPMGTLRRMSKAVRMGVMAALPLLQDGTEPAGIIIGTANAGMEDCFYFLKQMVDYNEGLLTPGNFVQSTPNALASQLSMLKQNHGYNITHVHLGLAFENAMTDAGMMIKENPRNNYLLGAVDDIPSYNYILNSLAGWFKKEPFALEDLYTLQTPGSIAGEGTAMFLVNGNPEDAIAQLRAVETIHTEEEEAVKQRLKYFLEKNLINGEEIDVLITGENGDSRLLHYYLACEEMMPHTTGIARFKHMCGEYPTATAMALWLGCYILQKNPVPSHIIKKSFSKKNCKTILIYNNYKGGQHSFILLSVPGCF